MSKTMTVEEFVPLAISAGRTLEFVERNAKGALFSNHDLTIHVGSEDVVIPLSAIKDYFDCKSPPPEIIAAPSPLLTDFMADTEEAPPPPPAAEVKKSGGKK